MKKCSFISFMLILLFLSNIFLNYSIAFSKNNEDVSSDESNLILGDDIAIIYEINKATDVGRYDAVVIGDGLNLRKYGYLTAPILERMYIYETVTIDMTKSNASFFWVKRHKTGTIGFASKEFIQIPNSLSLEID